MVLMLIDTNRPSPPSQAPHTGPRWRVRRAALIYVAGLAATIVSGALAPVPAYVVLFGVCVFLGLGLGALIPRSSGLSHHRQ